MNTLEKVKVNCFNADGEPCYIEINSEIQQSSTIIFEDKDWEVSKDSPEVIRLTFTNKTY